MSYTAEQFLAFESAVWSALATGDVAADAYLLADDFLGVYPSGFAGKDQHVGQLRSGPTVASHELFDARIQVLSEDVVLLAYRATWTRHGKGREGDPETMYVTSIWRREGAIWRNIFSQDTAAGD